MGVLLGKSYCQSLNQTELYGDKGGKRLFHVKGGCVDVLFIRDFMDGSDHPVDQ